VGRPSLEDEVKKAAQDYIAEALTRSPIEAPLSTAAVAKAIGRDRRVLKKYGLDIEIDEAAKLRKRTSRCKVEVKRRTLEERISEGLARERALFDQVNALVAHQSLLEANMKRFDLDPEELFRPIVPPNRSVSGAIRSRRSGRA
jgi:hypothetical protein